MCFLVFIATSCCVEYTLDYAGVEKSEEGIPYLTLELQRVTSENSTSEGTVLFIHLIFLLPVHLSTGMRHLSCFSVFSLST